MIFKETGLKGCYLVSLEPFADERGWFSRTYCEKEFGSIGFHGKFVQLNHSYNKNKGTFRGLHFQKPPFQETKLVRCIRGAVIDFLVDLRRFSPTFLQTFTISLSSSNMNMLLIPEGVAHGYQTLEDDTELIYHHTAFYNEKAYNGIRYDDPMISIELPIPLTSISEKDKHLTLLDPNFVGIEL